MHQVGYAYQLVSLSHDRLLRLWGCRDDELLERVETDNRRAVEEVLLGGTNAEAVDLYYALESICFTAGTLQGELDTRDVERVEALGGRALFPTVSGKWPLPLPDSTEWPFVGVATAKQLADIHAALRRIAPPAGEDERSALEAAVELFSRATAAHTDAIIFLH